MQMTEQPEQKLSDEQIQPFLEQIFQKLKSAQTAQSRSEILEMLRNDPRVMAAYIKQRQQRHPQGFGPQQQMNIDQQQPIETPTQASQTGPFSRAMSQLFEMGFWNETLNQELLQQNKMDIGLTVEKLLESGNTPRPAVETSDVVNSQPAAASSSPYPFQPLDFD